MADPFERMTKIHEKALTRIDKALAPELDPDVEFFNSLTSDDLKVLAREKGLAGTIDFVKRMEARRLGVLD